MHLLDVNVRQYIEGQGSLCPGKDTSPIKSSVSEMDLAGSAGRVAGIQGRIKLRHCADPSAPDPELLEKEREQLLIYEYLCHIGEAKEWIESCIGVPLGNIVEMEEKMRDGIWLAQLAVTLDKDSPPKRIFTDSSRLQFRHSDNINIFMDYMRKIRFPEIFYFELTDLYDMKNFPKVVYCIHALGCFLSRRGIASPIKNLVGKLEFTQDEISAVNQSLDRSGVTLPCFKDVTAHVSNETAQYVAGNQPSPEGTERLIEPPIEDAECPPELSLEGVGYPAAVSDVSCELTEEETLSEKDEELKRKLNSLEDAPGIESPPCESLVNDQALSDAEGKESSVDTQTLSHMEGDETSEQDHLESAALAIQRAFRKSLAKEKAQYVFSLKNAVLKLEDAFIAKKEAQAALERDYINRMATVIQSAYRGHVARKLSNEKKIELEIGKAKAVEDAFKRLSFSPTPSVSDIRILLQSINDNGENYIFERECAYRRKELVKTINEHYAVQRQVNYADRVISLLVQNMKEPIHVAGGGVFRRRKNKELKTQSRLSLRANDDPSGVPALSTSSISKLSPSASSSKKPSSPHLPSSADSFSKVHYGELLLLLRTRPKYLANLLLACCRGTSPHVFKSMEDFVKVLLSGGGSHYEEHLFMSLILELAEIEISEHSTIESLFKSNPIFVNFFIIFTKIGKNGEYLKDVFSSLVQTVVEDITLDLDLDPVSVYDKESKRKATGSKEKRMEEHTVALNSLKSDPDIKKIVSDHVHKLITTSGMFLSAIIDSAGIMPINMKYVLTQIKLYMQKSFRTDNGDIMKSISILVYYKCFSPVISMPDKYGIFDGTITHIASTNLAEISRILNQISTRKLLLLPDTFNGDVLNKFIIESHDIFKKFLEDVTGVYALPGYSEFDLILDALSSEPRPCIRVKEADVYMVHKLLLEYGKDIMTDKLSDLLGYVLKKLPPPQTGDSKNVGDNYLDLVLDSALPIKDEDLIFHIRLLLVKAKELVMTVLRIQTGENVFDVLEQPTNSHHEEEFQKFLKSRCPLTIVNKYSCNYTSFLVEPIPCPKYDDKVLPGIDPNSNSAQLADGPSLTSITPHTEKVETPTDEAPTTPSTAQNAHPTDIKDHSSGVPITPIKTTDLGSYIDLVLERSCSDAITFSKFKRITLEILSKLEKGGEMINPSKYCGIAASIAAFIIEEKNDPDYAKKTLASLNDKLKKLNERNVYLYEKKRSYDEYVQTIQGMMLSHKKYSHHSKFHFGNKGSDTGLHTCSTPDSINAKASHQSLTVKSKALPISYNFDSSGLHKKGVVVNIGTLAAKDYSQVQITITLKKDLKFTINSAYFMVGIPDDSGFAFVDLLSMRDDGIETVKLAQDITFNVEKLINLLNKKYVVSIGGLLSFFVP